jgi:hypothetical protein
MTLPGEAKKPAAAKTKPPVTLKHLAADLAEEHQDLHRPLRGDGKKVIAHRPADLG